MNQAEQNYSTTEREALALVEGIQKFQPYLHNHNSLHWLMNVKDASGRLARWALLLQQYDYNIVHRPGRIHGNADCLSRRPYDSCEISSLKNKEPQTPQTQEMLIAMIDFPEKDILPSNDKIHTRFYSQAIIFILVKMVCFTTLILIEGVMLVNLFLSFLSQLHYVLKFSLMYMIICSFWLEQNFQ